MNPESLKFYLDRNPFKPVLGENGEDTGLFLTCPVRLAFADSLAEGKEKVTDDGKRVVYGAALIVPADADLTLPKTIAAAAAESKFGKSWRDLGLISPFKPQARMKAKGYGGFGDAGVYFDCESNYRVQIFGAKRAPDGKFPELDPASDAVYSGMWCLAKLSVYSFKHKTSGVKFGLRSLQKIADDEEFRGESKASDGFGDFEYAPGSAPVASAPKATATADFW